MLYAVGTHIDLSYLNRKPTTIELAPVIAGGLFAVGTQFIFEKTPSGLTSAMRIPVAFA
jgi:hypothetical protein